MKLQERLETKSQELQALVQKINQMDQQKQEMTRQAIEVDGQIKILKELITETDPKKEKK